MAKRDPDKKPDSPILIQARNAATGTGAILGASIGGLRGIETGAGVSGIQGMEQGLSKFKDYAKEDAAREATKNAQRYIFIEGDKGVTKHLRGRVIEPKTARIPIADRLKTLRQNVGRGIKEGAVKSRYAAEDALYGARKWLTRSSVSRSVAIGAGLGAGIGRFIGHKSGQALERASAERAKQMREARIRRQATDIAKAHVMAKAISENIAAQNNQRQLSEKLDRLIEFREPDRGSTFRNLGIGVGALGAGGGIGYAGYRHAQATKKAGEAAHKIGEAAKKFGTTAEAWGRSAPASLIARARRLFKLHELNRLIELEVTNPKGQIRP